MCPRTSVSPCTQSLPRPSLNTGSSAEVRGRPGVGPEGLHTLGVGASCLTAHPTPPLPTLGIQVSGTRSQTWGHAQ